MHKAASKQGALALRPLTPPQRPAMAGPHLSLRLSDPITQRARHRIAHTDITTPQPQSLRPHGYNAPRRKRGEVATCGVSGSAVSGTRARDGFERANNRENRSNARDRSRNQINRPPLVLRRDWPDAADGGSTCDGPRPSLRGCRPARGPPRDPRRTLFRNPSRNAPTQPGLFCRGRRAPRAHSTTEWFRNAAAAQAASVGHERGGVLMAGISLVPGVPNPPR